ncbi:MAG: putative immunity protein [Bacilli bacterium]
MSKLLFKRDSFELQLLREMIENVNHRTLVLWTIDCAQELLPLFFEKYPYEKRPVRAIETAKDWSKGRIKMKQAKLAAKETHQCAREINDLSASSFAHAIGHVIGTVHVETHALGFIIYTLTAYYHRDEGKQNLQKYLQWFYEKLQYWEEQEPALNREWAPFLQKNNVPNKEKLLHEKLNKKEYL